MLKNKSLCLRNEITRGHWNFVRFNQASLPACVDPGPQIGDFRRRLLKGFSLLFPAKTNELLTQRLREARILGVHKPRSYFSRIFQRSSLLRRSQTRWRHRCENWRSLQRKKAVGIHVQRKTDRQTGTPNRFRAGITRAAKTTCHESAMGSSRKTPRSLNRIGLHTRKVVLSSRLCPLPFLTTGTWV